MIPESDKLSLFKKSSVLAVRDHTDYLRSPMYESRSRTKIQILCNSCCVFQDCVFLRVAAFEVKWAAADTTAVHIAHYDHFQPTYRVPSGTSRAKAGGVSSDPFGRKLRHGRSRERRSQRGRHHAKGTRYVGEIGFMAAMLGASAAIYSLGPKIFLVEKVASEHP